jgi:poly(hydroxyalkanoate) depolymerase family esterase
LEQVNPVDSASEMDGLMEPAQAAPGRGKFLERSYSNQAGRRAYKLYVPSGYHDGQAIPLLVMLHGCSQSPDDFAAGTRMNALAEEHTCLVAYPAQPSSAHFSKCWNWFSPGDQQRDHGEPSLIAGITRDVMHEYAVDRQRVYVAGLSAGAAAAVIMGTTYPDLYAAIGVHSGLAYEAASGSHAALTAMHHGGAAPLHLSDGGMPKAGGSRPIIPTIVFHGDHDATVHPRNGDQVIAQATGRTNLESKVERGQVPGGHAYSRTLHTDPRGQPMLEQWVIQGAGHAWSGGSPTGSHTDPRGPDAAREMLRFFLEHPHAAAATPTPAVAAQS